MPEKKFQITLHFKKYLGVYFKKLHIFQSDFQDDPFTLTETAVPVKYAATQRIAPYISL